ncbi:MAG: hypothetical protein J0M03_24385 [Acidobacteria bacterium]|nr:hypothetical protein [Acidobacteriota bacterium]
MGNNLSNQKSALLTKRTLKQVAKTIAQAFNDTRQLTLYQHYCETYPLKIIEQAFDKAQSTPLNKIKKNRAAIFFFFINTYAKYRKNYSRH